MTKQNEFVDRYLLNLHKKNQLTQQLNRILEYSECRFRAYKLIVTVGWYAHSCYISMMHTNELAGNYLQSINKTKEKVKLHSAWIHIVLITNLCFKIIIFRLSLTFLFKIPRARTANNVHSLDTLCVRYAKMTAIHNITNHTHEG